MADERPHIATPSENRPGDAPTEITGSSCYNDHCLTHRKLPSGASECSALLVIAGHVAGRPNDSGHTIIRLSWSAQHLPYAYRLFVAILCPVG